MMFPLVLDLAADGVPVAVTCRVLGFSKQAFYRWKAQPVSDRDWADAHLINAAIDIHHDDPEFGYRFITDELADRGITAGRNRGQPPVHPAEAVVGARPPPRPAPPTRTAGPRRPRRAPLHRRDTERAVADRHHRAPHRRGQALPVRGQGRLLRADRRLLHRRPHDLPARGGRAGQRHRPACSDATAIVHSDRGSQFRSHAYQRDLRTAQLRGSMGRVGTCADNTAMESFFSLLQKNVLNRRRWATRAELRLAIVSWIETTYHRRRRQDTLGRLTPSSSRHCSAPPPTRP